MTFRGKSLLVASTAVALSAAVADAVLSNYTLIGSCTFSSQWSGESCTEFRSSWTAEAMAERCATETAGIVREGEGCPAPQEIAGWCVIGAEISDKESGAESSVEASSMMISAMSDCDGNKMACETFMSGVWEDAAGCASPEEGATTDILIESFDSPKFLWESFIMDEDRLTDMKEQYENEYKEDGNSYDRMQYYGSITGSSMEVVDGIMVLTANISDTAMNWTMGGGNDDKSGENSGGRGMGSIVTMGARGKFPNLSTCDGLLFEVKTTGVEYDGYKVDFGYKKLPDSVFGFGFRASLTMPPSTAIATTSPFTNVVIPFGNFTLDWDWNDGTTTTSCEEEASYCPDRSTLQNLETITLSAVGATNGVARLHIRSIHGTGCDVNADVGRDTNSEEGVGMDQWTCASDGAEEEDEIVIESFAAPSLDWMTQNDPVMGGKSYSSIKMMGEEGTAVFTGEVKDVPALGVPGFIQMETRGGTYPDVSCCTALKLTVMAMQPYAGYRVSFGTKRATTGFFAQGFKADFAAPTEEFGEVVIPFDMFSVEWDEATGDQTITCAEDPSVCPDTATLVDMETVALWGEGVGGAVVLHVKSISAVGCGGAVAASSSSLRRDSMTRMLMFGVVALTGIFLSMY